MASYIVLIGFGDTGRVAADVLYDDRTSPELVVVDTDPDRLEQVIRRGATAVLGNGADVGTLRTAKVHDADQVIVAVADDAFAMRITAAVRSINDTTMITALVREPRWRELAEYLGADHVVVVDEIVGRLLGLSVRWPARAKLIRDLAPGGLELAVAERAVRDSEIGRAPSECGPMVLAVIRDDRRVWREDPTVTRLRPEDRLLVLCASTQDK